MNRFAITDVRSDPGDSAFLIDDGKTAILYDSGFAFTGFSVAQNIRKILGNRPLDYIFLTHSHYDHALGSAYIRKAWPDVKVVACEYAASVFSRETARNLMRELDRKAGATNMADDYEDLIDELSVDIKVCDGDVIRAGDYEFAVLELPGHTKCSIGYYCESQKLLLSCETIGVYNGDDDVVPSYLVGYRMAVESIERVMDLDIQNILVPHYGLLDKKRSDFYLSKAKESAVSTAEAIVSMLKSGAGRDEIIEYFKNRFYKGYIKEIYPVDAMLLNTGITIDLLSREFNI